MVFAMIPKPHIAIRLHGGAPPSSGALRRSGRLGGDPHGLTLRAAWWTNNVARRLTSHTVPGYFEVVGQASSGATVRVNTLSTYRRGERFRMEARAVATGDADVGVGSRAFADGGMDARVAPAAGGVRAPRQASEATESVSILTSPPAARVEGASEGSEIEVFRLKMRASCNQLLICNLQRCHWERLTPLCELHPAIRHEPGPRHALGAGEHEHPDELAPVPAGHEWSGTGAIPARGPAVIQ